MTYSIVALDKQTGELGVAVQSHWFNTGGNVPSVEGGVGAIALQALCAKHLGPPILELLRDGRTAADALVEVIASDPLATSRQIALVDARGNVGVHTGAQCISVAGHATGDGFSVQANIMVNDAVVPAMKETFLSAKGTLAERMMATLDAAEEAGGDLRGRQSAGMIIEAPDRDPRRRLSLQVCDHREPLVELRRLLVVFCAYQLMDEGDAAIASGEVDYAVELYKRAISLVPDNLECRYWYAVSLLNCGRSDDGNNIMREIYAADSRWQQLSPRLVDAGLLTELTPR